MKMACLAVVLAVLSAAALGQAPAADQTYGEAMKNFAAKARAGDADGAAAAIDDALRLAADDQQRAGALLNLGMFQAGDKLPDKAMATFNKVLALPGADDQRKAIAMLQIGGLEAAAGNFEEARKTYNNIEAMAKAPRAIRVNALLALGQSYIAEKKNYDKAREAYARVLSAPDHIDMDSAEALYYTAQADAAQKKYDSALDNLAKAKEMKGLTTTAKTLMKIETADCLGAAGKIDDAITLYDELTADSTGKIISDPTKARLLLSMGNLEMQRKQFSKAKADYQKVADMGDKATPEHLTEAKKQLAAIALLSAQGPK